MLDLASGAHSQSRSPMALRSQQLLPSALRATHKQQGRRRAVIRAFAENNPRARRLCRRDRDF